MSYITQSDLTQFKADILPLLGSTAIIERPTDLSDSQGGYGRTYRAIGTVPVRLDPFPRVVLSEVAISAGERIIDTKNWLTTFPAGTDIKPIDKVSIAGAKYEVVGVRSPRTDQITTRCECVAMDVGGVAVAS